LHPWSKKYSALPAQWKDQTVRGLFFRKNQPSLVYLYTLTGFCEINIDSESNEMHLVKVKRKRPVTLWKDAVKIKEQEEESVVVVQGNKLFDCYQPILFMACLNDSEFVVVEKPWLSVAATLPPAFYRPRFGN
jgi:U3 small nucleolar RNA-associated protein 4